jgi:hypothetical protein
MRDYTGFDLAESLTESGETFSIRVKSSGRKTVPQFFAKICNAPVIVFNSLRMCGRFNRVE